MNSQEAVTVRVDIAGTNTSSPGQIFTHGRDEYMNLYVSLYQTVSEGNWKGNN